VPSHTPGLLQSKELSAQSDRQFPRTHSPVLWAGVGTQHCDPA